MTQQQNLLTPDVKALIGQASDVTEMYGVVDQESVRRFIVGIPDQDPRHWDAELASPRFGGTTTPAAMVSYIGNRQPPWQADHFHELMLENPLRDQVSMHRAETGGLPDFRSVAKTKSHLHGGDEVEIFRYPNLGDRIFYQTRYANIEEKVGRDGTPFLVITRETRFWNQDDETILIVRALGLER